MCSVKKLLSSSIAVFLFHTKGNGKPPFQGHDMLVCYTTSKDMIFIVAIEPHYCCLRLMKTGFTCKRYSNLSLVPITNVPITNVFYVFCI